MPAEPTTGTRHHQEAGDLRRLLADVVDHTRTLLHLEVELAKQEARRALAAVRRGLLLGAVGAVLSLLALGVLVTALVAGLATVWPVWLAAAVVAIAMALLGAGLMLAAGKALRGESLKPKATLETIRETRQWLKARI
jgi:Putative Actinobacterial Holin-X, holin superfamily III